ncbi:MAG: hypothetical protein HC817_10235 [Saprospiraceae bacterium]|nr:hypothetical protein [Saprospiraceae bacterium]
MAEALAIKNGRILEVGKQTDIDKKYNSPNRFDAKNKQFILVLLMRTRIFIATAKGCKPAIWSAQRVGKKY